MITAHADVAMDAPQGQCQAVVSKGPEPRQRVMEIGVYQSAVYVEDHGFDGHISPSALEVLPSSETIESSVWLPV
jgi:hypothetical protein